MHLMESQGLNYDILPDAHYDQKWVWFFLELHKVCDINLKLASYVKVNMINLRDT